MIVLKPGEGVPSDSDESRPSSGNSRSGSANRVERTIPTIKRKSTTEKEDALTNGFKENLPTKDNGDPNITKEISKAPLELIAQFLNAVMEKDYKSAQLICPKILEIEPNNATIKDFQHVLTQTLNQDMSSDDESLSTESDDSDFDEDDGDEDTSDEDSESEVEDDEEEESDEELTLEDIKNLNLFMGGMSIVKK